MDNFSKAVSGILLGLLCLAIGFWGLFGLINSWDGLSNPISEGWCYGGYIDNTGKRVEYNYCQPNTINFLGVVLWVIWVFIPLISGFFAIFSGTRLLINREERMVKKVYYSYLVSIISILIPIIFFFIFVLLLTIGFSSG